MKKLQLPKINREKYNLRNAGPFITAFMLPILVMTIVFVERGIFPFGERCFLRTDLYHQYAPFFKELQNKLLSGGSLLYSWNIGAGTNFWTLSSYYLASPLNFFIILCPTDYVIEFVTWQIVMKLGLCSLTMSYYLNKKHDFHQLQAYPAAFFGTFYALSGYMAAYQWNVMWLDCIWLFPLVILGLERLVKENKGLLYSITLGFTILSNYYIAIMVCMGVAVYCFFLLGTEKKMLQNFGVKLIKFICFTVVAVVFSFVYLIPYIFYFQMTASAGSSFTWAWYQYFSIFDMIARHLMNVQVHTGLDNWPNIYCGIAVFMLIPFYYLNKKITLREKIGYTIVILFFYFSFSNRSMDYIWHVFHIPNSLPCRQAFIYIFILLVMAYRGFIGIEDRTYRDITFSMLFSLVFVFLAEKLMDDTEVYTNYVFYISALFIILYTIVFYGYRKGKIYKDILLVILLALCCVENTVNTSITSVPTVTRSDYTYIDEDLEIAMDEIREAEGDNFFRMEKIDYRTKNDGAWLNFPSISTFSSVANANLTDFYKKLGLEASFNAYGSMGQTFFTNMLMSVKYSISEKKLVENDKLYKLIYSNNSNVWIYENKCTLPVAFLVSTDFEEKWTITSSDYLKTQNHLSSAVTGVRDIFENVTPTYEKAASVTLTIPEDGYYYINPGSGCPKSIRVTCGEESELWENLDRGYTIVVGYRQKGDEIVVKNVVENSSKTLDIKLYKLNEDSLVEAYQEFSKGALVVDHFEDTKIEGHIYVEEDSTLLATIGQEPGWEVYVDGVKVDSYSLKKAYICVDLTPGNHTITYKYHVPFFAIGLCCTLAAGLTWILVYVFSKRREKKLLKTLDRIEEAAEEITADATADSVPDTTVEIVIEGIPEETSASARE